MNDAARRFMEEISKNPELRQKTCEVYYSTPNDSSGKNDARGKFDQMLQIAKEYGYELSEEDFTFEDGDQGTDKQLLTNSGGCGCSASGGGGGVYGGEEFGCGCVWFGMGGNSYKADVCVCTFIGAGWT